MCFPSVGDDWLRMALGRTSSSVMALFHSFSVVALSLAPVTVSGCLMGLIGIDGIIHTVRGWLTRVGLLVFAFQLYPGGWKSWKCQRLLCGLIGSSIPQC